MYDVGKRFVELQHRLCYDPRFQAILSVPVYADHGAKIPGRATQVRWADREQTRFAPGHQEFAVASGEWIFVFVAQSTLANLQIDQFRKPEAYAQRATVQHLFWICQRDTVRDHLQQKYAIVVRRHDAWIINYYFIFNSIIKKYHGEASYSKLRPLTNIATVVYGCLDKIAKLINRPNT